MAGKSVANSLKILRKHAQTSKLQKKTSETLIYKVSEASQLEATTRFELVIRVLQTHALPLGYVAIMTPTRFELVLPP